MWALLCAGVAIASAGCSSSKTCTLIGCTSGVSMKKIVAVADADVPNLELTVCRNATCSSARVVHVTGSLTINCDLPAPIRTEICSLSATSTAGERELSFRIATSDASDGDTWSVKLGVAGAAPVLDWKKTVTYATSQPNGPGCEPTCRSATLE